MTPNLTLILVAATMLGTGVYLLLARSIVRALVGFLLMSNGINVLYLVASGPAGEVPILGEGDGGAISDPIPQALVLTAIVITLALTAFVLSLAHRAWQLGRDDLLEDDEESARIHRRAEENDMASDSEDDADLIAAEFAEEDDG
ncbi:Na(+)/H(+) antiporter subunit C [Ornithinimicrobium sp. F0845]|uniref:Na(+)/H(+) antiporter subunit C n=1 Tax=Ornithinimicrobium sp. F0845 TaxID=2926412 RepID=UPI001FF429FB|nr:Na(+)/H(+) antiporter subunit C [Ornithinimicrobium sp. F0845]MCK0114307.1 Na(+)/H(+) antiporter subunit C [Ornithinimicrobium sp. F0845]